MQVQQSFRGNAHLTNEEDIVKAKQAGISALGNYYTLKAYDMAREERMERDPILPQDLRRDRKRDRRPPRV